MTQHFRPIAFEWLIACLVRAPIHALILFLILIKVTSASRILVWVICSFVAVLGWELIRLWRTKIVITDQSIFGRVGGEQFNADWVKLKAVWEKSDGRNTILYLATLDEVMLLPIKKFDRERIGELIRQHVSVEVLIEGSYKQLPWYQVNQRHKRKIIERLERPLKLSTPVAKWGGLIVVLLGSFVTISSFLGGFIWLTLICFLIVLLGAYLIFASGTVVLTQDQICFAPPFRRYVINWDEVARIEMDSNGGHLVLYGNGKQMACPGPESWGGKDKEIAQEFLVAQVEVCAIEVSLTEKAIWRMSKNTKVAK